MLEAGAIITRFPRHKHWRRPTFHQTRPTCQLQSDTVHTGIAQQLNPGITAGKAADIGFQSNFF